MALFLEKESLSRIRFVFIVWLLGGMSGVWAGITEPVAEREGISEHHLDNGLRIVLAPDDSVSSVYFNLVYLTGSLADPDGKGGAAHLLEHLMFKGTEHRSGEQLVDGLRQRGIHFNATTSFDRTRYSAVFESDPSRLDYLLELEAERMAGLHFDQNSLDGEIDVVLRELELAQDNPLGELGHRMMAAATPGKGYGRHVLGTREELHGIGLDDLKRFHELHYRPDNAVIVMTGGFDPEQVLESVGRYFGALESPSTHPVGKTTEEPFLTYEPATVQVTLGSVDVVALAYPAPPAHDPRNIALAALADIFAGEPHGRLYQTLVLPDSAQAVFAVLQSFEQGGHYLFGAQLGPEQSMEEAQTLLIEQIESVARHRISAEELQRVLAGSQHMRARVRNDPATLAEILSESVALGDWQLLLERFDRFSEIDVDAVQREAEAFLVAERRLIGQLRAGNESADAPQVRQARSASERTVSAAPRAVQEMPDLEEFNSEIMAVESSIQRGSLDNGMKVALRPLPGPSKPVQGSMVLRFGDLETLRGMRALAEITGTVLIRGSRDSSYQQVVDRANRLGAGLAIVPGVSSVTVRFESPGENFPELLELMAEVLQRPAFPRMEFELIKRQRLQALQTPVEDPSSVANLQLRRHVERYDEGDIRRRIEVGEMRAAVRAVSHRDLRRFHEDFYGADQGEVAITGSFDPAEVMAQLNKLFGDWNTGAPHRRAPQPYEKIEPARLHVKAKAPQTGFYIGRLHFQANSKSEDTAALMVAEHILGRHPLASRLGKRLRDEEGLTYDIRSSIKVATFDDDSWVNMQGGYPLGQGHRLADIVREEVVRLIESGITQEELDIARSTILNERRLSFSQDRNILSWLPRQLYEGVTMESWVERNNAFAAVTVEQVNEVVRRYFDVETMVEVLADADAEGD